VRAIGLCGRCGQYRRGCFEGVSWGGLWVFKGEMCRRGKDKAPLLLHDHPLGMPMLKSGQGVCGLSSKSILPSLYFESPY